MATAQDYAALARRIATEEFGDSPLAQVFYRMMQQESAGFAPDVVEGRRRSSAGAIGIAQFMEATARQLGVNPLDPTAALHGGARYLKSNIDQFGGDVAKGVAAYNAGGGNVQEAVQRGGVNWVNFLPGETQSYLAITKPGQATDLQSRVQNLPATLPNGQQPASLEERARAWIEAEKAKGYNPPSLEQALQDWAAAEKAKGQTTKTPLAASPYAFPVQGYQGQVQLHWGEDRGASDIFAPPGAPVVAMVGGTVSSAGYSDIGGNNVTLQGDDGNIYYMAHLIDAPLVKPGQRVEQGTPLGGVGDTGNAKGTGAHLHTGIGPSIISGTGPKGGSGADFDAVGLLQNTLAGSATYNSTGNTGGAAMPAIPQFTYTSPYATDIAALREKQTKGQARLAELQAKGPNMTPEEAQEFSGLQLSLPTLTTQLNDLIKIDQSERQFAWEQHQATVGQQANAATGIAGLRQQGFQNGLSTVEAIGNIINAAFGRRLDLANILRLVDESNRTARLNELNTMIAMGQLDMAQAAMRFDVQERQQAAELAWTVQAAQKAGWIADEERKNALMFLPEGTHFQPGFEPNGAINATFAKWGIPPMVIGVAEVDRSRFDPERNLARGAAAQTAMGAPLPQFDTSETTAAADRVRGTAGTDVSLGRTNPASLNLPAPTNPDALIGQLPGSPDTSDIESYLQGLLNPDVGIPSAVSPGTPPAPAQTQPSGGAANQVGTPPTEEATRAAQASSFPGEGQFITGNNGGQGQTQNSTIPAPKDDEGDGVVDTIWDWLTRNRRIPKPSVPGIAGFRPSGG